MDARTLEALKGSIAKWEAIVAGTGKDRGYENCPLCKAFNGNVDPDTGEEGCFGCPVRDLTGEDYCKGSPYTHWADANGGHRKADTPQLQALAQAELEFLRSLLPSPRPQVSPVTGGDPAPLVSPASGADLCPGCGRDHGGEQ